MSSSSNSSTASEKRLPTNFTSFLLARLTSQLAKLELQSGQSRMQNPFEESYSPKTGIRTATLLGGMLILLIISLLWRGRARLWRLPILSSIQKHRIRRSKNKSKAKFDLDYWLKQVDILEAKEAERYRECVSPYLELPREEPRDNRLATASWIIDAWYHWRWIHSAEGQAMIDEDQTRLTNYHTNRRKQFFRRLYRRFRNPSEQCQTTVTNHSHTIPVEMTSNHVEISTLPASSTFDIFQPPRRVASWPRLQTAQILVDSPRSALQIQLARQKLLQHSKRIRFSS